MDKNLEIELNEEINELTRQLQIKQLVIDKQETTISTLERVIKLLK
jgi:hypothetical protein